MSMEDEGEALADEALVQTLTEVVDRQTGEVALAPKIDSVTFSIGDVREQIVLIQELMKGVMLPGEHYGKIPGCGDKDILFKAGAEKLCLTFRMAPKYTVTVVDLPPPHREYRIGCELYHIVSGRFLGAGVGSGSTLESKYRYRRDAQRNKVENPDIADQFNTVLKMAKKRALVDAVLTATAASDIFTQDMEDIANDTPPRTVVMPKSRAVAESTQLENRPPVPEVHGGLLSHEPSGPRTLTAAEEAALMPPVSKFFPALHKLARDKNVPTEKLKWVIKESYGKSSSKLLSDAECAGLIKLIQDGGLK